SGQVLEDVERERVVATREQREPGGREPPAGCGATETATRRRHRLDEVVGRERVEMATHTHPGELQLLRELGNGDAGTLAQQQEQLAPRVHREEVTGRTAAGRTISAAVAARSERADRAGRLRRCPGWN